MYTYISRENVGAHAIDISILRRKTPTKGESTSFKRELSTWRVCLGWNIVWIWMESKVGVIKARSPKLAGSASFSRLGFVAHRPFRSITDETGSVCPIRSIGLCESPSKISSSERATHQFLISSNVWLVAFWTLAVQRNHAKKVFKRDKREYIIFISISSEACWSNLQKSELNDVNSQEPKYVLNNLINN